MSFFVYSTIYLSKSQGYGNPLLYMKKPPLVRRSKFFFLGCAVHDLGFYWCAGAFCFLDGSWAENCHDMCPLGESAISRRIIQPDGAFQGAVCPEFHPTILLMEWPDASRLMPGYQCAGQLMWNFLKPSLIRIFHGYFLFLLFSMNYNQSQVTNQNRPRWAALWG